MAERYFVPDDAIFVSVEEVETLTEQPTAGYPTNCHAYYYPAQATAPVPSPVQPLSSTFYYLAPALAAPPPRPTPVEAATPMSMPLPTWSHTYDPTAPLGSLHNPYPAGCAPNVHGDARSASGKSAKTPERDCRKGEGSYYLVPQPRSKSKSTRRSRAEDWEDYLEDVRQQDRKWRGHVFDPQELGYYPHPSHPVPPYTASDSAASTRSTRKNSYERHPIANTRSPPPKSRHLSSRDASPPSPIESRTIPRTVRLVSTQAPLPPPRNEAPPLDYHVFHPAPTSLVTPMKHISFREGPDSVLGSARGKWNPAVRRKEDNIGFRHVAPPGMVDDSHNLSTLGPDRRISSASTARGRMQSNNHLSDTPQSTRAVYGESPATKNTPLQKLYLPDTPHSTRAVYGGSPYPSGYIASSTAKQPSPPSTTQYSYPPTHRDEIAPPTSHQHIMACRYRETFKPTPHHKSTHRRAFSVLETETAHPSSRFSVLESEPSESHLSMPGSWDFPPPEKRYILPVYESHERARRPSPSPLSPRSRRKRYMMSGALPSPGHPPTQGPPNYRTWTRLIRVPSPPPPPPPPSSSCRTVSVDEDDYYDYRSPVETVEIEKCHVCGWAPWEMGKNGVRFCWGCWEEAREAEGV
ncbi:MAG: hypothetical protein MMC33_010392 [Icmadophila ericetorum]|nr:hypothetical protein [Icmadophila ericetorum]